MSYFRLDSLEAGDPRPFEAPQRSYQPRTIFSTTARITSILFAVALLSYAFVTFSVEQREQTFQDVLDVDVGYAIYRGHVIPNGALKAWQGIRYAAPPVGEHRFRAPRPPMEHDDRGTIVDANSLPPRCPQSPSSPRPDGYGFQGEEDCLFLSVYAPKQRARSLLPVFFYIHGGGYGAGDGGKDVTDITRMNDMAFVSVVVQYRLEAFGFLAGSAVEREGGGNAGLRDQHLALEWVQQHIHKFGGDPRRVTIAGQSAGGGSVQMLAMANGGSEGTRFFDQGIASSPYNPVIYQPSDAFPERNYLRFAKEAGCFDGDPYSGADNRPEILWCLRNADTEALQLANFRVGSDVNFGSWAFVPVIDGEFIQERPSQQLPTGKVNGRRILTSYNANEGAQFILPSISTQQDFDDWLLSEYPMLTSDDIHEINSIYASPSKSRSESKLATCGDCNGPTAMSTSSFAVGHLQRAMNFYAEATFDCPAYWLASAYQNSEKEAYVYQFSLPPADHGADLTAEALNTYRSDWVSNIGPDFYTALTTIWGNFITTGDPSIAKALANGQDPSERANDAATKWPLFKTGGPASWLMLNLNQTGGQEALGQPISHLPPVELYTGPGLRNDFRVVNASTWEGGRGARCDLLRRIGARVPV